jgi:hypothetical protein
MRRNFTVNTGTVVHGALALGCDDTVAERQGCPAGAKTPPQSRLA